MLKFGEQEVVVFILVFTKRKTNWPGGNWFFCLFFAVIFFVPIQGTCTPGTLFTVRCENAATAWQKWPLSPNMFECLSFRMGEWWKINLRFTKLRSLRAALRTYFYSIEGNVNNYKDTQSVCSICVSHIEKDIAATVTGQQTQPCQHPGRINEMPSVFGMTMI